MLDLKDLRARDAMSPLPEVVAPHQTVVEAYRLLTDKHITSLPVVTDDGRLVGVFTIHDVADCFDAALQVEPPVPGFMEHTRQRAVEECLPRSAVTCELDTPLLEACKLLIKEKVHRLVVTDGERPVGILSAIDVVRSLACLGSMKGAECK
jgi:CBS domain-containing protein